VNSALTPARASVAGTAVLMACACGAAANSAKLVSHSGIAATATIVQPIFLGVGVALVLYGLWHTLRTSAYLALVAFAVLAAAAALTPPRMMTGSAMPWSAAQMAGGALYLVAAALLAYAFWRAFPSTKPAASGTAMGGMALATGCNCCMVTGAVAGMAVTTGASSTYFQSMPIVFVTGLAVVAAGLFRLGGARAAMWVALGGLITTLGPRALQLTGDWMVADVNMRFIPGYLVYLAGAAVILRGFVVAYEQSGARVDRGVRSPAREPAPLGMGPLAGGTSGD